MSDPKSTVPTLHEQMANWDPTSGRTNWFIHNALWGQSQSLGVLAHTVNYARSRIKGGLFAAEPDKAGRPKDEGFTQCNLSQVDRIGFSGWDYDRQCSYGGAFDIDLDHGGHQHTPAEIDDLTHRLEAIPWVYVCRSTNGKGLHIWIIFAEPVYGVTNRAEHAALIKAAHRHLESLVGPIDVCEAGGNTWIWNRLGNDESFRTVKRLTCTLHPNLLGDWRQKIVKAKRTPGDTRPDLDQTELANIRAALGCLGDGYVDQYKPWLTIGQALHDRSPTLFGLWDEWSSQAWNYEGTSALRSKWDGFGTPSSGTYATIGTLYMWAKECGFRFIEPAWEWSDANPSPEQIADLGIDCPIAPSVDHQPLKIVGRPTITLEPSISRSEVADKVVAAMSRVETYQRAGLLVRAVYDSPAPPGALRSPDAPAIQPMPLPVIRSHISDVVRFDKWARHGPEDCEQPEWLGSYIEALHDYPGIPTLEGVTSSPRFLSNGSILSKPGYDHASGLYYHPLREYGDVMDLGEAKELIEDCIADFPFLGDSKGGFYSLILSIAGRHAYSGPAPFHLILGNRQGVGKGLLATVGSTISTGHDVARSTAPANEEEWRKRITSLAIEGGPLYLLDNLEGKLDSAALAAALTADRWTDRLLGRNEQVSIPLLTVFAGTGNNLSLSADILRRTCPIQLESMREDPESRDDFRHENLVAFVRANQPQLTMAALSLLHHYHQAGRPDMGLPAWGSFEGWSRLIRNCIVWCDRPDPANTRAALKIESSEDDQRLARLFNAWQEADPLGEGMSVQVAMGRDIHPTMKEVIDEYGKSSQRLGNALAKYKRRVLSGKYFDCKYGKHTTWNIFEA